MNDSIAPDRIGRFSRAELQAMRGKRGRKPAEYFELFPDLKREPTPRAAGRVEESAPAATVVACAEPRLAYQAGSQEAGLAARLGFASPEARQLVGNLLDLLGVPRGNRSTWCADASPSLPPAVGDAVIPPASDAAVEESSVAQAPAGRELAGKNRIHADPVYADPEADTAQVVEDETLGLAG